MSPVTLSADPLDRCKVAARADGRKPSQLSACGVEGRLAAWQGEKRKIVERAERGTSRSNLAVFKNRGRCSVPITVWRRMEHAHDEAWAGEAGSVSIVL